MNRAKKSCTIKAIASLCLPLLACACPALAMQPGESAPAFTLRFPQGTLSSRAIAGRVAVITAETKDTAEVNRMFKTTMLQRWPQKDGSGQPAIVPVVACFSFPEIFRQGCESAVARAAEKEGLTIYTDSEGAMFRSFGFSESQSTICILDKKGVVRFWHAGKLDDPGVQKAVQLIEALLRE
jgi:hypothetical protein